MRCCMSSQKYKKANLCTGGSVVAQTIEALYYGTAAVAPVFPRWEGAYFNKPDLLSFPKNDQRMWQLHGSHSLYLSVDDWGEGQDVAMSLSFSSPWVHMPSELITCLEGSIRTPSNAP